MRVVIVGAGFGGVAAAIELKRHGFEDLTIIDAAPELGGTWHYNTYPGAACDVPSHFYSFSYAQRRDWSRLCSPQAEILDYLHEVARTHDVDRHLRLGTRVTGCHWDDTRRDWTVHTRDGEGHEDTLTADALVLATGQLNQPAMPKIDGLESFEGHTFHSARWDHDYDLRGKRVAVVGTGASAVQFVPEVAKEAGSLTIFQRTGNWFMPRRNRSYPGPLKTIIKRVPGVQSARRWFMFRYMETLTVAIRHPATVGRLLGLRSWLFMRWQLRKRDVRRKVWPDYTFGCKRILFSSAFLPALQRDNVEVVTDAVSEMTPTGPVTADGRRFDVDCVIYATGFRTNDFMFPMEISGTEGRRLREEWAGGAHAHLGMTVPGFPSMFLLYGPNTNTSGGSIIFFLEQQVGYLRQALQRVQASGAAAIDVRPEVEQDSDQQLQDSFAGTAWTRCDSWYRNDSGRIVANWPGYMSEYAERSRTLDPTEFTLVRRPAAEDPAAEEPVAAS
jgi:cation diffusion facilitator CzcD-associated flavoprotein CzcO